MRLETRYLFRATGDSSLRQFHLVKHDLRQMCEGTWVDDRAWVCLAELEWWSVTGAEHMGLVMDAIRRYDEAQRERRFSSHEGSGAGTTGPPARAFITTGSSQTPT